MIRAQMAAQTAFEPINENRPPTGSEGDSNSYLPFGLFIAPPRRADYKPIVQQFGQR